MVAVSSTKLSRMFPNVHQVVNEVYYAPKCFEVAVICLVTIWFWVLVFDRQNLPAGHKRIKPPTYRTVKTSAQKSIIVMF
jgi:hypothetical protein